MLFGVSIPTTLNPCLPFLEFLCVYYWQETLTGKATQPAEEKEAKRGLVGNVREQSCSFVHSPACLPAFQSTIQTPESLDKGRLCPPICRLHPALLLPPILPFSPSCCTSSASRFSLAGPYPRIAQQVSSENRAGDVGRVKLSLSLFFLLCISLSLSVLPLLQNLLFNRVIS